MSRLSGDYIWNRLWEQFQWDLALQGVKNSPGHSWRLSVLLPDLFVFHQQIWCCIGSGSLEAPIECLLRFTGEDFFFFFFL